MTFIFNTHTKIDGYAKVPATDVMLPSVVHKISK